MISQKLKSDLSGARVLIGGLADEIVNRHDLVKLGAGSHRHVYETPDGTVVKVAEREAEWSNENEMMAYMSRSTARGHVPKQVHDMLTPVILHAEDGKWIEMEKADVAHPRLLGETDAQIVDRFMTEMGETGWGIEDPHRDNIAIYDGKMVTIDYEYLKPIDKMLPKPKDRWEAYR